MFSATDVLFYYFRIVSAKLSNLQRQCLYFGSQRKAHRIFPGANFFQAWVQLSSSTFTIVVPTIFLSSSTEINVLQSLPYQVHDLRCNFNRQEINQNFTLYTAFRGYFCNYRNLFRSKCSHCFFECSCHLNSL